MAADQTQLWLRIMRETKVLRLPQRSIATFGPTHLPYFCLSPYGEQFTRLRSGIVLAEKPKIYLKEHFQEIFEGFDDNTRRMARAILEEYGDKLRALGYTFRHRPRNVQLLRRPFEGALDLVRKETSQEPSMAILRSPDKYWEVSLIKFTVEIALKSIHDNVTELEEHGFFDPEKRLRMKIERLFYEASQSRDKLPTLAKFLQDNGLFQEYEDRFFSLVKK